VERGRGDIMVVMIERRGQGVVEGCYHSRDGVGDDREDNGWASWAEKRT
jgi:hypothetical protein